MLISLFILQLIKHILSFSFHCLTLTVFNFKKKDISVIHLYKLEKFKTMYLTIIGSNLMHKQI